jgi:ArsR family transcriptional regulator
VLRDGDRTVAELIPAVGLESSHLSQQLAVLRRARVVTAIRSGSSVSYSIADPAIVELLAAARSFLINNLSLSQELLADLHQRDLVASGAAWRLADVTMRARSSWKGDVIAAPR